MWQILLEKLSEPGLIQSISAHIFLLAGVYLLLKKLQVGLKVRSAWVVLSLILVFAELFLRLTGTFATYLEKKSGHYASYYKYRPQEALHKRKPGENITLSSPGEFSYDYSINSLGYNDIEWHTASTDSTFKILILGDSFTEGFGAPQDSSWVAQLRQLLAQHPFIKARKNPVLFNAGISAADPYTNLYALQNELYQLKPDLVVQVISNQDFDEDFLLRGGYERFTDDDRLSYQVKPKYEWLYAYSHLSRVFFHHIFGYNQYLQKSLSEWGKTHFRLQHLEALTKAYEQWADSTHTKCLLLFMDTDAYQIAHQSTFNWEDHLFVNSKHISIHSVIPCMYEAYQKDSSHFYQYWWEDDGHHNSHGYGLMAKCVLPFVLQSIPEKVDDLSKLEEIPSPTSPSENK